VASWQTAYRGLVCDEGLDSLSVPDKEEVWKKGLQDEDSMILVCEADSTIVGFANCWPCRDKDKDSEVTGEIGGMYLHPDYWGKGHGKQLMQEAEQLLRERGYAEITLWVLEGNSQARQFYEKAGFVTDGREEAIQLRGSNLVKVRYVMDLSDFTSE